MKIGPHMNIVNVRVIPNSNKAINNSLEDSCDEGYDSAWTSEFTTSDSESKTELDLYALDLLPQVVTDSMHHSKDIIVVPSRRDRATKTYPQLP